MPVQYPMPDWLHGADPIRAMSAGSEIGLRQAQLSQNAGLAQERLDAEERMAERDAQVKEETMRMQQMRETQQLAQEDAYNQAQIGLKRSALELETQKAAQDFQAQQQYKQIYQQLIAPVDNGGQEMDPTEAAIQAALQVGPALGQNIGQLAALMKAERPPADVMPKMATMPIGPNGEPMNFLYDPKTGTPTFTPEQRRAGQLDAETRIALQNSKSIIDQFNRDFGDPIKLELAKRQDAANYESRKQQYDEAINTIKEFDPKSPYAKSGSGKSGDLLQEAKNAIQSGAPVEKVKARYKQLTGQDLPL